MGVVLFPPEVEPTEVGVVEWKWSVTAQGATTSGLRMYATWGESANKMRTTAAAPEKRRRGQADKRTRVENEHHSEETKGSRGNLEVRGP